MERNELKLLKEVQIRERDDMKAVKLEKMRVNYNGDDPLPQEDGQIADLEKALVEISKKELLAKAILRGIREDKKQIESEIIDLMDKRAAEEKMPLLRMMIGLGE